MIVTCRYKLGKSLQDRELQDLLFLALARVITQHPALCCSIIGEETANPVFGRLGSIELCDVVTLIQLKEVDNLVHHLEQLHDETWTNLNQQPAWKVVAFRPPGSQLVDVVEIAFVFHHALADGLSGAAFHRLLLQELLHTTSRHQETVNVPNVINVSRDIRLTDPLEDLVQLPLSWGFLAGQVLQEYGPRLPFRSPSTVWAGARCQTLEELPYRSRLRILSIPAERVEDLLNAARSETTTLTSFITGTIVVVLADLLPAAKRFVGITPYTMRRISRMSTNAIVNQISVCHTFYGNSLLNDIRVSSKLFPESTSRIWKVARYFQNDMKAELAKVPQDNLLGLLPYISNYRKFYQKKLSQPREATFEVSNLGAFNPTDHRGHDKSDEGHRNQGWTIENIIFTQGAQVIGPAFSVNCASIRDGSLNLAFSWQNGVVDESVIDAIVREFERSPTQKN